MLVLVVWPFMTAVWIAFTNKSIGREAEWIGLANFVQVVSSPRFGAPSHELADLHRRGDRPEARAGDGDGAGAEPGVLRRNFLRAYLLIPWVLPGFVAYMIWRWFLDPLQGVANYALTDLGLITFPLEF